MSKDLCGWIAPEERTPEQHALHEKYVDSLEEFKLIGSPAPIRKGDRFALWACGRELKNAVEYVWQSTGSCVGAAWGSMLATLMRVEIHQGELEEIKPIWWPYTYGIGRMLGGMRGRGSGSFGGAQMKAATEYGALPLSAVSGAEYGNKSGWRWLDRGVELKWSDGRSIAENLHPLAKEHPCKKATRITAAGLAAESLQAGYPLTIASGRGEYGVAPIKGTGSNRVHLSRFTGRMAHQMFIDEFWDNADLGPIFRVGNQWGPKIHGEPTGEEPAGGNYITADTLDDILRSRSTECFAFSAFDGFRVRQLDYNLW